MPVGDQDTVQPLEPNPALQDLALRAFAAINQETVFVVFDNQRR